MRRWTTMAVVCALCAPALVAREDDSAPENTLASDFAEQAENLSELVRTNVARDFLDAVPDLPGTGEGRTIRYDRSTGDSMTQAAYEALPEDDEGREAYDTVTVDDTLYYTRLFGTPALYTRALDLASVHGFTSLDGARVFDFGFGQIGHLRAMASCGAHCVGVEVNPLLKALYSEPGDTGLIERHPGADAGPPGTLRVLYGKWPGDEGIEEATGGRFDLILSKNVLKRGYIHPEREANPAQLIDLGVDDARFIAGLHDALVPGGLVVIYNFSPQQAPEDEPFIPWADGRCPFDEDELIGGGFEVLAYNVDDTEAAIDHFVAVGASDPDEVGDDLVGTYTVLRRAVE